MATSPFFVSHAACGGTGEKGICEDTSRSGRGILPCTLPMAALVKKGAARTPRAPAGGTWIPPAPFLWRRRKKGGCEDTSRSGRGTWVPLHPSYLRCFVEILRTGWLERLR